MKSLMIGLLKENTMVKKAYLSHPIMGKQSRDATEEYIEVNNAKAAFTGHLIRAALPELDLHVPSDMEAFVHRAYKLGHMTIDQILDVDCNIITECDVLLVYDHEFHTSSGMQREIDHANSLGIPIVVFNSFNDEVLLDIERALSKVTS